MSKTEMNSTGRSMECIQQAASSQLTQGADRKPVQTLWKIAASVVGNRSLQEDLFQEALIHFWVTQEQRPGQSLSWYLQSCRFHLLNHLNRGGSLDSLKRRHAGCPLSDVDEPADMSSSAPDYNVSTNDIIEVLSDRLTPRDREILRYLSDGFGVREIAQKLELSHQAVSKRRRKIAIIAMDLGITG